MNKRRILLGSLLAIAASLPVATPQSADARVFIGIGLGVPFYAPYYPPPPPYYYPPPVVYAPPPVAYGAPAAARCVTAGMVCPLRFARPVGASCGCPDVYGRYIGGRVG